MAEFSRENKIKLLRQIRVLPDRLRGKISRAFDDFDLPDDDGSVRCKYKLLEEVHRVVLPKLMRLRKRFPRAFITIGETISPHQRDRHYSSRVEYHKRRDMKPPVSLEEQILFRSNHRFNCKMVEYLLIFHLNKGVWKERFSKYMNPQKIVQPCKQDYEFQPAYVYAQFSTIPTNAATIDSKNPKRVEESSD
jgi:hypothetical protein